jgi:hypothetical protein
MKLIGEQCWASFGPRSASTGLAQRLERPSQTMTPAWRESGRAVTARQAPVVARPPVAHRRSNFDVVFTYRTHIDWEPAGQGGKGSGSPE